MHGNTKQSKGKFAWTSKFGLRDFTGSFLSRVVVPWVNAGKTFYSVSFLTYRVVCYDILYQVYKGAKITGDWKIMLNGKGPVKFILWSFTVTFSYCTPYILYRNTDRFCPTLPKWILCPRSDVMRIHLTLNCDMSKSQVLKRAKNSTKMHWFFATLFENLEEDGFLFILLICSLKVMNLVHSTDFVTLFVAFTKSSN